MEHGDFKEAKKYATSDSQSFLDMIDKSDEAADGYKDKELIVTDKSVIHDDGADVEVEDKLDAQMIHYHLQKEGGVWKVSFNLNALERTAIDTAIDAVKKTGKDVQKDINEALDSIKIDLDSSK